VARGEDRVFDIGLSLTERCGHGCRHCSTNASLDPRKASVPFRALKKALSEMAPFARVLSISCEGDPFFYGTDRPSGRAARQGKTIVDVIGLAGECGIEEMTIQFHPPRPDRFPMLEELLGTAAAARFKEKQFQVLPLISFHLFGAANGLACRVRVEDGKKCLELYAPGVPVSEAEDWFARAVSLLPVSADNAGRASKMVSFLDDVYRTILLFVSKGIPVHFEVRGDSGPFTSVEIADAVLDMVLKKLDLDHPEIPFPRCPECDKIHYNRKSGYILPLGRAASLFFDGQRLEERLYEDHIRTNEREPLCPNWNSWGEMTVDTKGYPQLCYSNVALTPGRRTTTGPNLYRDGFEVIRKFYLRVWEDRRQFLEKSRKRLDTTPHDMYCPLPRFRKEILASRRQKR
jgi:hypothetical protein